MMNPLKSSLRLAALVAALSPLSLVADEPVQLVLHPSDEPKFAYDLELLEAPAGAKVSLKFENKSKTPLIQPHNVIVIVPKEGEDKAAVVAAFNGLLMGLMQTDPLGATQGKVPDSDYTVLGHTAMLQPGQEETIEFTIPEDASELIYICTFPGHIMTMNGIIKVTAAE